MKYQVQVDVTMTGEICIDARNEYEAQVKASQKFFIPHDLRHFRFLSSEVVDVQKDEE